MKITFLKPIYGGIALSLILLMATSCLKDNSADYKSKELAELEQYLIDNNITVQPRESGLYYIETLEGQGDLPVSGDTLTVDYKGQLINGFVFDSTMTRGPFIFQLGVDPVIPGWEEGISLMKKGGKATLIIPSSLAYGANGSGLSIPPYATLVFDVDLVDIKH